MGPICHTIEDDSAYVESDARANCERAKDYASGIDFPGLKNLVQAYRQRSPNAIGFEELVLLIHGTYWNGWSMEFVASQVGYSAGSLSNHFRRFGLPTRSPNSRTKYASPPRRKYPLRSPNAFQNMDSPIAAYWLGFLWGDGTVSTDKGSLRVRLKRGDEQMLQELRTFLVSGAPVKLDAIAFLPSTGKWYRQASLDVYSRELVNDLTRLGLAANRGIHAAKLPTLRDDLRPWFIRGLFDADGHLQFSGKRCPKFLLSSWTAGLCIGAKCAEKMAEILRKFVGPVDVRQNGRSTVCHRLSISGPGTFDMLRFLYPDDRNRVPRLARKEKLAHLLLKYHAACSELGVTDRPRADGRRFENTGPALHLAEAFWTEVRELPVELNDRLIRVAEEWFEN